MKSFLTAASYGGSAVIVLEDFFIGVTFFCHAVGAVLAHSHSVAGPCGSKGDGILSCGDGKVGGIETKRLPNLFSGNRPISDSHLIDPSTAAAGEDFDPAGRDGSEADIRIGSFDFCGKLGKGQGQGFFFMGGVFFVRAFHTDKVRDCGGKTSSQFSVFPPLEE